MRSRRVRKSPLAALGALALVVLSAPCLAAAPVLVDRIVALVDDRPLMLSEARALQVLRGLDEARAVEALVDEHLMEREAQRLPRTTPTAEEEERARASLEARLAASSAHGGPAPGEDTLRQVARRQLTILKYVEYRFRPQVRVGDEALRQAYAERWDGVPDPPTFESVAGELRERLERDDLDRRLEAWVVELRRGARVRRNTPR